MHNSFFKTVVHFTKLLRISESTRIYERWEFPKKEEGFRAPFEMNGLKHRIMRYLNLEQFPKLDRDREELAGFIFSGLRARGAGSRVIESGIDQT